MILKLFLGLRIAIVYPIILNDISDQDAAKELCFDKLIFRSLTLFPKLILCNLEVKRKIRGYLSTISDIKQYKD